MSPGRGKVLIRAVDVSQRGPVAGAMLCPAAAESWAKPPALGQHTAYPRARPRAAVTIGPPHWAVHSLLCSSPAAAVLQDPASAETSPCPCPTYHCRAPLPAAAPARSRAPRHGPYIVCCSSPVSPTHAHCRRDCTRTRLASFSGRGERTRRESIHRHGRPFPLADGS